MNLFPKMYTKLYLSTVLGVACSGMLLASPMHAVQSSTKQVQSNEQNKKESDHAVRERYQLLGQLVAFLSRNIEVSYGVVTMRPSAVIPYAAYGAGLLHTKYPVHKIVPLLLKQAAFAYMHDELAHEYGYQPSWLTNHAFLSLMAKTVASSVLYSMISQGYSTIFES